MISTTGYLLGEACALFVVVINCYDKVSTEIINFIVTIHNYKKDYILHKKFQNEYEAYSDHI